MQALQPIIAGDKVLVTSTDSLTCLDKATGAVLWKIGGFPYIIGDLRGAPTVDIATGRVYVGGAGAQSFNCFDLSTGAKIWSRNLGGGANMPLNPGQTSWTPSVLAGGVIYFTQETGYVYALDAATGVDVAPPLNLPDAPGAVPYNALTSDGTKLWIGTANSLGTAGNIHQIDAASMTVDWTLNAPGVTFYPGNAVFYNPEGFPGSMAYEDGVVYYHSQVRNDGSSFAHAPQTGSVGAIDVALEDGSGVGILWVNDASSVTVASPGLAYTSAGFSGPALGPGMLYLNSRGFFAGTAEQDGVSAWDKVLGTRIWYNGYTNLGVSHGFPVMDDVRGDAPISVFCQPDGTPYIFVGNAGGVWRLMNGNTGAIEWERTFSERVAGTALADDFAVTVVRTGSATGGGSIVAFSVGADRPRLQLDTQFVFRTAATGDGPTADVIADVLRNSGCVDLNISSYGVANPPLVRVSSVHPILAASAERRAAKLSGYDALLNAPSSKRLQLDESVGSDLDEPDSPVRAFASKASAATDPVFLTVTEAPSAVAPGAAQSIAVIYDETGLSPNAPHINYIEINTDDPDYYPQDPLGVSFGLPVITFELYIGCPDASTYIAGGIGEEWVSNFGATGFFNGSGFHVNGTDWFFDGGYALVVQDSVHWAFDGCSVGGYPRRAGEWAPVSPCGLAVSTTGYPRSSGTDIVQEVQYAMIDAASPYGFFSPPGLRQCGGVRVEVDRLISTDPAFSDFALARATITNEHGDFHDITGPMHNVYFGSVTDWKVGTDSNYLSSHPGNSYAIHDGTWGDGGPATGFAGHVRLDADAHGAGPLQAGGSPCFMMGDIQNDQGNGDAAFRMLSNPGGYLLNYCCCDDFTPEIGAVVTFIHIPVLADGASETCYFAVYQVENGVNGLPWSDDAGYEASVTEIQCRAKAFAGFGKGDVNCDECVDLADVVLLGNIVDGLVTPSGGSIYTADADGDNDIDESDYELVYDVLAGIQQQTALANAWRFN